jgi:xanthosine utilization system XapX-like protein
MELYLMLLGAGLLVVGEQLPPLVKAYLQQRLAAHSWLHQVRPHMFGELPGRALASQERRTQQRESQE